MKCNHSRHTHHIIDKYRITSLDYTSSSCEVSIHSLKKRYKRKCIVQQSHQDPPKDIHGWIAQDPQKYINKHVNGNGKVNGNVVVSQSIMGSKTSAPIHYHQFGHKQSISERRRHDWCKRQQEHPLWHKHADQQLTTLTQKHLLSIPKIQINDQTFTPKHQLLKGVKLTSKIQKVMIRVPNQHQNTNKTVQISENHANEKKKNKTLSKRGKQLQRGSQRDSQRQREARNLYNKLSKSKEKKKAQTIETTTTPTTSVREYQKQIHSINMKRWSVIKTKIKENQMHTVQNSNKNNDWKKRKSKIYRTQGTQQSNFRLKTSPSTPIPIVRQRQPLPCKSSFGTIQVKVEAEVETDKVNPLKNQKLTFCSLSSSPFSRINKNNHENQKGLIADT